MIAKLPITTATASKTWFGNLILARSINMAGVAYNCSGIGVFFNHVNLHQAIIHGSHISYCKGGGITIVQDAGTSAMIAAIEIQQPTGVTLIRDNLVAKGTKGDVVANDPNVHIRGNESANETGAHATSR